MSTLTLDLDDLEISGIEVLKVPDSLGSPEMGASGKPCNCQCCCTCSLNCICLCVDLCAVGLCISLCTCI